jgi:hypothetical protein
MKPGERQNQQMRLKKVCWNNETDRIKYFIAYTGIIMALLDFMKSSRAGRLGLVFSN